MTRTDDPVTVTIQTNYVPYLRERALSQLRGSSRDVGRFSADDRVEHCSGFGADADEALARAVGYLNETHAIFVQLAGDGDVVVEAPRRAIGRLMIAAELGTRTSDEFADVSRYFARAMESIGYDPHAPQEVSVG